MKWWFISLSELSDREQELADYLRAQANDDHTRAGSSMSIIGDGLEKEADSRMRCDGPLARLQDELNTFQSRAIADMTRTTKQMEKLRRDYRAGLLWLKDASKQLDPEDHKQLVKYREAQVSVKEAKREFDRLKFDVSEKIELLGASYCSLLSNTLHPYYTTLYQIVTENQQNFKELLKWSRSHQQHQYRLLKDILEEQQEKLREAAATDCGEMKEDTETSNNLLADIMSWSESTDTSTPDVPAEVSNQLTVGEALKHILPGESHVDDENGKVDDSNEQQGLQAARSSSLENLMIASDVIREAQLEGGRDDGHMTSEDFVDPLLANMLERESSPPPALDLEDDDDDELDKEFKKLTDSLATLQPFSHGQADSDLLATLSQTDVILPSDLLDLDPTDLSSLDFTPCLAAEVKEETHSETSDSGEATSREQLKVPVAAKAKTKESLSSWLNVFSHLDPLDNPDLLEGSANSKEEDEKQAC